MLQLACTAESVNNSYPGNIITEVRKNYSPKASGRKDGNTMKKQNKEVSVTMRKNAAKKGIELIFTEKPAENIRAELKAAGYRWHATGEYWYAKDTAETRVLANKLAKCKITADEAKAAQPAKAKAKTKAKAEDRAIVQTGTVEIPIAKYNEMVDAMKRVKELQKQLEAIKKALA